MTPEEYKEHLRILNNEHSERKLKLVADYVKSNAKHKRGDVVTNGTEVIAVNATRGLRYSAYDAPIIAYHGILLKKDMTPRKDGQRYAIDQDSIIPLTDSQNKKIAALSDNKL